MSHIFFLHESHMMARSVGEILHQDGFRAVVLNYATARAMVTTASPEAEGDSLTVLRKIRSEYPKDDPIVLVSCY